MLSSCQKEQMLLTVKANCFDNITKALDLDGKKDGNVVMGVLY